METVTAICDMRSSLQQVRIMTRRTHGRPNRRLDRRTDGKAPGACCIGAPPECELGEGRWEIRLARARERNRSAGRLRPAVAPYLRNLRPVRVTVSAVSEV